MSKIAYARQRFNDAAAAVIAEAERICDDYAAQGYQLTLRQLYYRFIAGDLLPESRRDPVLGTKNTERNYKWLGELVSSGRIAGLIDWAHITDRTRTPDIEDQGWSSPESMMTSAADGYVISHWEGQPEYVEVWVEKEALGQVIRQAAGAWDVSSFACKGSPSTSAMHDAAVRFRRKERRGHKVTVIYLGDHDPTGIDISRDIQDRLALFLSAARVDRIALNMDQVEALNPPPSPVKVTDSRTNGYIDRFGTDECWELDAIEPADLDAMIQAAIQEHLDPVMRQARLDREERERGQLVAVRDNWPGILAWLGEEGLLDDEDDG